MLTQKAVYEIVTLQDRAMTLSRSSNPSDRAESSVLLSRIAMIKETGQSTDESRKMYTAELVKQVAPETVNEQARTIAFHNYLRMGDDITTSERRDLLAGTESITYTQGAPGGFLLPLLYEQKVFEALATTDPLLSADVCDFSMEPTSTLRPQIISGFDLSSVEASQVNEVTQQNAGSFPTVKGSTLRANLIFKMSIAATIEAEDDITDVMAKFSRVYGIAFARRLGADAINGNGTTQMQGLTTAISPQYTTGTGKITNSDIQSIYSLVNYVYRSSPKCAWLMSESVHNRLRLATDSSNRPLLSIVEDREELMSKPIFICPSLPAVGGSLGLNSQIVFGDLSAFKIRCSRPTLMRSINGSVSDISQGKALYIARIRCDSAYFDPSNNIAPAVVVATITS
jgi:HK97 family phage major capsid protein